MKVHNQPDALNINGQILARVAAPVAPAQAEVEDLLRRVIPAQADEMVAEVYSYVVSSGGKRLRPLLVLLTCKAAGGDTAGAVPLAVCVEVLHLASLLHDDVIDEADTRRGKPSARYRWGNHVSILMGDFLVAHVFSNLSGDLHPDTMKVLAQSVVDMCASEIRNYACENFATEEQYMCAIRGKTGVLMGAACRLGAMAADNEALLDDMQAYGEALGEGFQIMDDLLDLYGDPDELGKPVLRDLQAGVFTLPVLHALKQAEGTDDEARLGDLLKRAQGNPQTAREAAHAIKELGGRDYARQRAGECIARAQAKLAVLAPSEARESLHELAEFVLTRRY